MKLQSIVLALIVFLGLDPARADVFADYEKMMISAVSSNDERKAEALFNSGYVFIDRQTKNGDTYVGLASMNCADRTLSFILSKGGDANEPGSRGQLPIEMALYTHSLRSKSECDNTVKELVSSGADIEHKITFHDGFKIHPLLYYARRCAERVVRTMVEAGVNVNTQADESIPHDRPGLTEQVTRGENALHLVAEMNANGGLDDQLIKCKSTVEVLSQLGINVNQKNEYADTPIDRSWRFGCRDTIYTGVKEHREALRAVLAQIGSKQTKPTEISCYPDGDLSVHKW